VRFEAVGWEGLLHYFIISLLIKLIKAMLLE
jgi:hypothetical protein